MSASSASLWLSGYKSGDNEECHIVSFDKNELFRPSDRSVLGKSTYLIKGLLYIFLTKIVVKNRAKNILFSNHKNHLCQHFLNEKIRKINNWGFYE